jgi:uncharacterized protein YcfL
MKTRFAALFLGLLLPACRSKGTPQESPGTPDPMLELPGDPRIESDLETLDVRMSDSGGERILEFGLRNKSSSKLPFAWTLEWYDSAGARIAGSARAWTSMTLEAGATRAIQVHVPSPDASSWRLRAIRPGSNTLTQGDPR